MIRNYIRRRRSVGSSGSPPPESASLTAQSNAAVTPVFFWGGGFCFASIGRGLSAAQHTALTANVLAYNTALGR